MNSSKRIFTFGTLAVFIVSFFITAYPVSAVDSLCTIPDKNNKDICLDDFFSGNDILYYDPNAVPCSNTSSSGGPLVGDDTAEKIFNYLIGKGLSAEQAAGVLGNFKKEATNRLTGLIDPAIIQGSPPKIAPSDYTPVDGVGFGIAQWTYTVRQAPLVTLAKSQSKSVIELSVQLDYLWQELNTTHAKALASLKTATTPLDAAYVFHRDYEGSADPEAVVIKDRGGFAKEMFDKYRGIVSTASSSNGCASSGSGLTSFLGDDFTIYNQCQYPPYGGPWGIKPTIEGRTACYDACIPTALAMISKNLAGQNVTPDQTIDYYSSHGLWESGGGSKMAATPSAATEFGLRAEIIANKGDVAAYKAVFDKGGLIIAMSTGTLPFLSTRHAVVLRGITAEGNFMVADPGRKETNVAPANQPAVDKILTEIRADPYSASYALYKQ